MVWGSRTADKYQWRPAFAWLPSKLTDGRWVWLEPVERISYRAYEIPVRTPCSFFFSWCYRLPIQE